MNHITKIIFTLLFLGLSNNTYAACINSETENNNSRSNANGDVCNDTLVESSLSSSGDIDWYSLNANTGNLSVSIQHHRRDDFDFEITDSSGTTLIRATTSNRPETASINVTAGTYFIRVNSYRGRGWYDLTATFSEQGGEPPTVNCEFGPRPSKPSNLTNWLTGDNNDTCPDISGNQGVLLMGGNFDVDEAFVNQVKPRINQGDVVVLRTSGSNGYNDYLQGLLDSNSVETLLVDSVSKANSDYVEWAIKSAEFVFIAGGDQADYLNQWKGTKVESALTSVYNKGGIIGGTSAGAMVQGESIYDPDGILSVYSDEAVTDPCHQYINVSNNFLNTPYLGNSIVDTHFAQRDRMGRLTAFMSRLATGITGIGVDEDTAMFIDANGLGVVDGDNAVYVLREGNNTNRVQNQCGSALIYDDIVRYKLTTGQSFNFANGQSSVSGSLISIDGTRNNFYIPNDPY